MSSGMRLRSATPRVTGIILGGGPKKPKQVLVEDPPGSCTDPSETGTLDLPGGSQHEGLKATRLCHDP